MMILARLAAAIAAAILLALPAVAPAWAQTLVACREIHPGRNRRRRSRARPRRRSGGSSEIKNQVKNLPYRVLFLGDSITQLWDPAVVEREHGARAAC